MNIFEPTEESISMAGDTYVSRFAGRRSSGNVPDPTIQSQIVCSFQDWYLQPKRRNLDHPQRGWDFHQQAGLILLNALFRPEAEVGQTTSAIEALFPAAV